MHCLYPFIHERIKAKGCENSLNLYPNLELLSVPSYVVDEKKSMPINAKAWNSSELNYKRMDEYLGIKMTTKEIKDIKEGLEVFKEDIKNKNISIVSGTSYFLNYSNNYKNKKYIRNYPNNVFERPVNHWLSIYGIENNNLLVYDPIPNDYIGEISKEDFILFWEGDRKISELSSFPGVERL
nr:hypothetical protein [Halonatronum saccharophilum]